MTCCALEGAAARAAPKTTMVALASIALQSTAMTFKVPAAVDGPKVL